jgi:hypothetical protein
MANSVSSEVSLPPVQCGLASEGQQRYTKYTKPLKTYREYIYIYIYIYIYTVGAR